jgi:BolA protein
MTDLKIFEQALIDALKPSHIALQDNSHQHAGHAEMRQQGGYHLILEMTSDYFNHKTALQRHRMIYEVLAPWLNNRTIHAIKIHAKPQTLGMHSKA